MADLLLNYVFDNTTVKNEHDDFPISFIDSKVVDGPGKTILGEFPSAIDLGKSGAAKLDVSNLKGNLKQFCMRFVFKVTKAPGQKPTLQVASKSKVAAGIKVSTGGTMVATKPKKSRGVKVPKRGNIFESDLYPFSLHITEPEDKGDFDLVMVVDNSSNGWSGCSSAFKVVLKKGTWYTASVVYDLDTLGLFIDGKVKTVHAFPKGHIAKARTKKHLYIGTWVDGTRNHFDGSVAAFQWYDGIPQDLENQLDEQRTSAEWNISLKKEKIKKQLSFGARNGAIKRDRTTGNYIQHYEKGAILYHPSVGMAFEIHGAIYKKYKAIKSKSELGYLVTDEVKTTKNGGKKSIFSKGGIYWSPATGAVPVTGEIYLEYENLGESKSFGFPTNPAGKIPGGLEQGFQHCRFYYKNDAPKAHEVHGSILKKLFKLGGVKKVGFPITNEMDVLANKKKIGRFSEFETCTIFWSSKTGAFEVHGDIRKKYIEKGGPGGKLGFPTSDEMNIPNHSGTGRINSFQNGSICWYGNWDSMVVALPFRLFLGRIESKENEGFGMGQNDLYLSVKVWDDGKIKYNKRHPKDGDYGGHNHKTVNINIPHTIVPNAVNKKARFFVKIKDADPGKDDHLGTFDHTLNASNGWGMRKNNGIHSSKFAKIKKMTWSVKPQVKLSSLSEVEKWWAVENTKTPKISWNQCASAFSDIDSETEWWDVTDWLQKAFYELVVEELADKGNCFGMALEGIYARKNTSLFSMPINRFENWNQLKGEFNLKHCYQVGAPAIWWFLGEFVSGNTRDSKDVFNETRQQFNKGNHPVVCIAQNWDFSGSPHCVLPIKWDSSSKPWKMSIMDPNFPGEIKTITVNPDNNSFKYVSSATKIYKGKPWSGGRFHYMPFSKLCEPPRTPLWEAIILILTGTVIILGNDAETVKITDKAGNDLDAFGNRALKEMQAGRRPENFFVGYQGFDRPANSSSRQILLRREPGRDLALNLGDIVANLPTHQVMKAPGMKKFSALINTDKQAKEILQGKSIHNVLRDKSSLKKMNKATVDALKKAVTINNKYNFIHQLKGRKNGGMLEYVAKHGLSEIWLNSTLAKNESNTLSIDDLGTQKGLLKLNSGMDKRVQVKLVSKLGVGGDYLEYHLKNIPAKKAAAFEIQMKQGVGGLEILNNDSPVDFSMNVKGIMDGKPISKSFDIPMDKGVRIKPTDLASFDEVAVTKIDQIFGGGITSQVIRKK